MPISGIGIRVASQYLEDVETELQTFLRAEVERVPYACPVGGESYLVVVLETNTTGEMKQKFEAILQLPGVIHAWVAYHNIEDIVT